MNTVNKKLIIASEYSRNLLTKSFLVNLDLGGGGEIHYVCFDLLIGQMFTFLFILNWNFRYLSWLRQYQTGKFVLLKQCYYCAKWKLKQKIENGVFYHPPILLGLNYFVSSLKRYELFSCLFLTALVFFEIMEKKNNLYNKNSSILCFKFVYF